MATAASIRPAEGSTTDLMDAALCVIPGENAAEFQALARDYFRQYNPAGPVERFFVQTLIHADWKRRRLRGIEVRLLAALRQTCTRTGADYDLEVMDNKALKFLHRQLAALERSYLRAITELRGSQKLRQAEPPAPQPSKPATPAPQPSTGGIGFVPKFTPPSAPLPDAPEVGSPKGGPKRVPYFIG